LVWDSYTNRAERRDIIVLLKILRHYFIPQFALVFGGEFMVGNEIAFPAYQTNKGHRKKHFSALHH